MKSHGFTLIEVLVALIIVAVGMAAVLAALTSAADTTAYLRDKSFAEWVAMNRISELRLQIQQVSPGKTSGDVEFAGRRWRWEQEVTKLEIEGVNRIDVRVRPADAPGGAKAAWTSTITGLRGNAVEPARGETLRWWDADGEPGGPGAPGDDEDESDEGGKGRTPRETPQPVRPDPPDGELEPAPSPNPAPNTL
jgi:general secretion pathway protein I